MDRAYRTALAAGYERVAAWSDLLDRINVFPVPDGDTGRNLKYSLAALRGQEDGFDRIRLQILKSAAGNAGNIAAAFIGELLQSGGTNGLADAIARGRLLAHKAVVEPKPGTMLTFFDVLAETVCAFEKPFSEWDLENIIASLEKCVIATGQALPELREAGVVDAGALGMFLFVEEFLNCLDGRPGASLPVTDRFQDGLKIAEGWRPGAIEEKYCVSALVAPRENLREGLDHLAGCGDSLVVVESAQLLKMHLHTDNREKLRADLKEMGRVVDWSETRLLAPDFAADPNARSMHIMTDAAGSLTVEDAKILGITLLDSYLLIGDRSYPETLYAPEKLYAAMAGGQRVSTAQASVFERCESYLSALSRYEHVLYLCVGSAYTGNFKTASSWRETHDPAHRLTILDTGTASGRLGIVALATARYARGAPSPEAVVRFARRAIARSAELVFLDQLKYLAAGGRLSKTSGFFGDLMRMKPVIAPQARGATRIAVVRTREGQINFALKRLKECFDSERPPLILLQYSDNQAWVEKIVARRIHSLSPSARVLCRPLSLTAGAHMGPGTWAVAYLPGEFDQEGKDVR